MKAGEDNYSKEGRRGVGKDNITNFVSFCAFCANKGRAFGGSLTSLAGQKYWLRLKRFAGSTAEQHIHSERILFKI